MSWFDGSHPPGDPSSCDPVWDQPDIVGPVDAGPRITMQCRNAPQFVRLSYQRGVSSDQDAPGLPLRRVQMIYFEAQGSVFMDSGIDRVCPGTEDDVVVKHPKAHGKRDRLLPIEEDNPSHSARTDQSKAGRAIK